MNDKEWQAWLDVTEQRLKLFVADVLVDTTYHTMAPGASMAKPKQPKQKPTHTTVKVPAKAYEHAQNLLKKVANEGWQKFGIDRTDVPTLGAVIEEGLKKLDAA